MQGAQAVLKYAHSHKDRAFSHTYASLHEGQYLEAYCAAFVRWCFRSAGIDIPVVLHPECYSRLGLRYVGGENTADGFAGRAAGSRVGKEIRPGDILLFRNTYGKYPFGTITHVGIASNTPGMMYDAGRGSVVYHRSIDTFGNLLVEVRRPTRFGGASDAAPTKSGMPHQMEKNATRVHYHGGDVSAKVVGTPVKNVRVYVSRDGAATVNGDPVFAPVISLLVRDASGKVYKMHKHDNRTMMTEGIGGLSINVHNGMLEVSYRDVSGSGGSGVTGGSGTSAAVRGSPHVDPKMPHVDPKMPHVDPKMPHVDPKMPHVERKMSHVDPKVPHVDPKTPRVEPKHVDGMIGHIALGAESRSHVSHHHDEHMHALKPLSVELTVMH